MDRFNTIAKTGEALFKEKGSKFFGYAFRAQSEGDVELFLNEIKALHPKAGHFCTAYKLGTSPPLVRTNDDGEPSNSAGKPILGQIESAELFNVFIVVARYFGGTKLGVGGLQTAYKTTAKLAIDASDIVEQEILCHHTIQFPFDVQGIVDHLLDAINASITEKNFLADVTYQCLIPQAHEADFLDRIAAERSIKLNPEN